MTPTGGQIETTAGVNLSQYYACMFGGQNNPGCSGYNPQPPSDYGYLHNQAANAFASGLKVDGALTLWSFSELLAQNQRTGQGGAYISPGLVGTPLGASLGGSLVSVASYARYTRKDRIEDEDCPSGCRIGNVSGVMITNFYLFVPGGGQDKFSELIKNSIVDNKIISNQVDAFFSTRPGCKDLYEKLLETAAETKFIDPRGNEGLLKMKMSSIPGKLVQKNWKGDSSSIEDVLFPGKNEKVYAESLPEFKVVLLGQDYFSSDAFQQQLTTVHELLHIYFRGKHGKISQKLKLRHRDGSPFKGENNGGDDAINNYLINDCKTGVFTFNEK
jgi:hypothetical protein